MVSFHGVNVTMPVSVSGSNPADFDDILFFLSSKLSLPDVYLYYTAILQILILVCVAFSTLVAMDRITHVLAYFWYKAYFYLTATKPEDKFLFRQIPTYYLQNDSCGETPGLCQDVSGRQQVLSTRRSANKLSGAGFDITEVESCEHPCPFCAVQLPMFNERAVCESVIDCACSLLWPKNRLIIQVLDDSTDEVTKKLIDKRAFEWTERGVNVQVVRRNNRAGYKAGAMKDGMSFLPEQIKYIAIFDADFRPTPYFLAETIPYLHHNPRVGYVQARWTFLNAQESLLTKVQEVSLNFHTKCEQWLHFASGAFFNFNGTAGVWRRETVADVGGWMARTTVEDMDLSLRAYLRGWKGIYLEDVTCLNEVPACLFAYRKQQHRWTCGPVSLWCRTSKEIWSSDVNFLQKLGLFFCFFGIRKTLTHIVALAFFGVLVPLAIFSPEINIPTWALLHMPLSVSMSTAIFTPRSLPYALLFVMCENAMAIVRWWAATAGFLGLKRANEWVVTTKLGTGAERHPDETSKSLFHSFRLYSLEALLSAFLLTAAIYGVVNAQRRALSIFLIAQGIVTAAYATNMVDCTGIFGSGFPSWISSVPFRLAASVRKSILWVWRLPANCCCSGWRHGEAATARALCRSLITGKSPPDLPSSHSAGAEEYSKKGSTLPSFYSPYSTAVSPRRTEQLGTTTDHDQHYYVISTC